MRGRISRTRRATGCRPSGRCSRRSPRRGRSAAPKSRPRAQRSRTRSPASRRPPPPTPCPRSTMRSRDGAFAALSSSFDHTWGGFGPAPKFPQPMVLTWLLRQHVRGTSGALEMATRTLDRMASGGIHDQVGGGFARYSTDARWHVPHFEKMLTDNALAPRALHARMARDARPSATATVALRTADYLLETLQRPEGGFASSQDADTDGRGGADIRLGSRRARRDGRRSGGRRVRGAT